MTEAAQATWNPPAPWAVDIVRRQHAKGLAKGGEPMSDHAQLFAAKVVEDALRDAVAGVARYDKARLIDDDIIRRGAETRREANSVVEAIRAATTA